MSTINTLNKEALISINNENEPSFKITPWQVEGSVDYDEALKQFGVEPLTEEIIARWESLMIRSKKNITIHPWIKRGIFFSHRRFNDILNAYESYLNEKEKNPDATCPIFIYTGRGPSSEAMHLGHLVPFIFTKYLQDSFDCNVVIQISDDETFYFKDISFKTIQELGIKNSKDIIAVGFDPKKTFIFSNHEYRLKCSEYEGFVTEMRKCCTFHILQKIFGFDDQANSGMIDWPIYQCAAEFYQSYPHLFKKPALISISFFWSKNFIISRFIICQILIHSIFHIKITKKSKYMNNYYNLLLNILGYKKSKNYLYYK